MYAAYEQRVRDAKRADPSRTWADIHRELGLPGTVEAMHSFLTRRNRRAETKLALVPAAVAVVAEPLPPAAAVPVTPPGSPSGRGWNLYRKLVPGSARRLLACRPRR